jgi:uncharacterized membrane protein YebE (DUF533 family)
MVDINKMLGSLNKSGISKGLLGGLAGGAVAGGLMSKKGRKMGKKALKYGGIAAVGGIAWQAYKQYQQNQSTQTGTTPSTAFQEPLQEQQFNNLIEPASDSQPIFILKTMVAAAMADGHMDGQEYNSIISKAQELGLDADEQRVIFDEIKKPMSIDEIAAQTDSPVLAMEVYTASVLAIDENAPFGKGYLQSLATRLDLPPPLVETVHREVANSV